MDSRDPYMDVDFNTDELKESMNSYAVEEKKAFSTPLSSSEMQKMEQNGKSLMQEITSGMKEYGATQFWRENPFFKKHNGF